MKNNGVKYGLFYGIGSSLLALLAYFIDPILLFTFLDWQSILSLLLMVGLMYWSAKTTKEEKGGYLSFGEAFVPTFLTYVIGNVIYSIFIYVLMSVDPALSDVAATATADMLETMYSTIGFSEDQILEMSEQVEDQMEGGNTYSIGNTIVGIITSIFFFGLPLSAIIAAIVKKKNPDLA